MKNKILEYIKTNEAKKKSEGQFPTYVAFVDMQNSIQKEVLADIKSSVNELIKEGKLKFTRVNKGIALYTNE